MHACSCIYTSESDDKKMNDLLEEIKPGYASRVKQLLEKVTKVGGEH